MWLCENNLVRYIQGLTENHYMLYLWTCVFNLILTFHTQLYSIRVELYAVILLIYDNTWYFKWFLILLTIVSLPFNIIVLPQGNPKLQCDFNMKRKSLKNIHTFKIHHPNMTAYEHEGFF